MRNYKVYFSIFDKKMQTTVQAVNEKEAKEIIKEKIVFYKVEQRTGRDVFEELFKGFGKK